MYVAPDRKRCQVSICFLVEAFKIGSFRSKTPRLLHDVYPSCLWQSADSLAGHHHGQKNIVERRLSFPFASLCPSFVFFPLWLHGNQRAIPRLFRRFFPLNGKWFVTTDIHRDIARFLYEEKSSGWLRVFSWFRYPIIPSIHRLSMMDCEWPTITSNASDVMMSRFHCPPFLRVLLLYAHQTKRQKKKKNILVFK